MKGAYVVLVGRPERKRPLVRPRRRWKDNIKMSYFKEMGWEGMDWTDQAGDRGRWQEILNVRVA
jgi:hypothetical protein